MLRNFRILTVSAEKLLRQYWTRQANILGFFWTPQAGWLGCTNFKTEGNYKLTPSGIQWWVHVHGQYGQNDKARTQTNGFRAAVPRWQTRVLWRLEEWTFWWVGQDVLPRYESHPELQRQVATRVCLRVRLNIFLEQRQIYGNTAWLRNKGRWDLLPEQPGCPLRVLGKQPAGAGGSMNLDDI